MTQEMSTLRPPLDSAQPFKDKNFALGFHRLMVRARVMEERLIRMVRMGEGYFWIGGPGEEAFSVSLGLLAYKGHGPAYDMLHLHYRSNSVALAMGSPMIDFLRQMKNSEKDPFSGGRNFVSHIAIPEWNILPVTSTIETQFAVAPGTGLAQRRLRNATKSKGITIVVGGDAGTAEGEFASCMIWSSRPGNELPVLMIVTNNQYGISTPAATQHGERNIADRGKAFGIQTAVIDGTSPEKAWAGLQDAMEYVRSTGKPFLLEVKVSRLYGHSSSSGANRVKVEDCPIDLFEKKLIKQGWLTPESAKAIVEEADAESLEAYNQVKTESWPDPSTVLEHSFVGLRGGMPGRDF